MVVQTNEMVQNDLVVTQSDPLMGFVILVVFIGLYVLYSYFQGLIGKKLGEEKHWAWYLIPIYNYYLLLKASNQSGFMILGMLIPYVSIVVFGIMFGVIAKELGKSPWLYGILTPFFGFITIPMLALSKSVKK